MQTGCFQPSPCILVIFGATGDLTSRKLIPALYNLNKSGKLPSSFACVAFARRDKTDEIFKEELSESLAKTSSKEIDFKAWNDLKNRIFYHRSSFDDPSGYIGLKIFLEKLDITEKTKGNRIFYFSTPPKYFPEIIKNLKDHNLIYDSEKEKNKWSRIVVEKPFGRDLQTAKELQRNINDNIKESEIYRIDHYLGKETVQNILTLRFSNMIFESFWNHHFIDHVEITVSESIGIGTRGNLFEEAGILKDMIQNHMMQLLSLTAMEPPSGLESESIKKQKVSVLNAIKPIVEKDSFPVVRGQYASGSVNGISVKGYREENDVSPSSIVETYAALKLEIDNPRWKNVPFYLRSGKRLNSKRSEIAIFFKKAPYNLFPNQKSCPQNDLFIIRVQPDEGAALQIYCKIPGTTNLLKPVRMDFRYDGYFEITAPEAYEKLLYDCMCGDRTLFTGQEEVMASWKLFTPVIERWQNDTSDTKDFPNYAAGSSGPKEADQLINRDERCWLPL
ncbi:MAG: glucose-6-phosphate dehydrogenase [Victivallaceae bacterium]